MHGSRSFLIVLLLLSDGLRTAPAFASAVASVSHQQAPNSGTCQVDLEGEVNSGASFRKSFGAGLDLLLDAVPHGWILRVTPSTGARPDVDFAELATPPFRSINPLLLTTDFGLRSQDLVGWNPRHFRYLRGRSQFPEARRAYAAVLSSTAPSQTQLAAVTQVAANAAEGEFMILDARLRPGTADQSKAAALIATHFSSTAHTIEPPAPGSSTRLGEVTRMRFRARFELPPSATCKAGASLRTGR